MNKFLIYSDFSDTIAKPTSGDKFPPFELELAKLVGIDITDQYKYFLSIRRNDTIPYEERMRIWLKPFIGLLTQKHIAQLISIFSYNENYSKVIELLKDKLKTDQLKITIVSGTLWQIIGSFLKKKVASRYIQEMGISFNVGAAKILFDKNGKYNGFLVITDVLAYSKASAFPEKCLIIGDNAMETYGFGDKLLNAQSFDEEIISERIEKYLSLL